MSRELDVEIAEKVMGWQWLTLPVDRDHSHLVNPATKHDYTSDWLPGEHLPRSPLALSGVPHYSTDLNACFEAQGTLVAKVGVEKWLKALRQVCDAPQMWVDWDHVNRMVTATAEQRCRAMLLALSEKP